MQKYRNKYYLSLICSVKGLNGKTGRELLDYFGGEEEFLNADNETLQKMLSPSLYKQVISVKEKLNTGLKEFEEKSLNEGSSKKDSLIRFTSIYDEDYPSRLLDIPDAPLGLWHIGDFPSDNLPSVAIIGSRQCSSYGEHIAEELGAYLGKSGIQVISGMARGIDGISQQAALNAGGTSFGVLGSGADICYPPSNKKLYEKLKTVGGIISTYPNGTAPVSTNFPPRNRIVSGLSDAVVVIEARQKSGTLITVDAALDQGREVFAVPGRITDRLSDGCNGLIGQGANVFLSPEIFICELTEIFENKTKASKKTNISSALSGKTSKMHRSFQGTDPLYEKLSEDEKKVIDVINLSPKTSEEVCTLLPGMEYATVSMVLMQLMIDGHIKQVSQGTFVRTYC